MKKTILVAGATGNLGGRIVKALIKEGAEVKAIVRKGSDPKKIEALKNLGVTVIPIDMANISEITAACVGVSCVLSALAGLKDVIVDGQKNLLEGAIQAGVPRFIPSDFCTDYTIIPKGENRNFDLRKEFKDDLDKSKIKATSIFNGCFADILRYNTPLFDTNNKTIVYYNEKIEWEMDFTTMDNTAAFTALASLDEDAPRDLSIASFRVSPYDLVRLSEQHKQQKFELVNGGSMQGFSAYNKSQRVANPKGEMELYASWQQSQYVYSMFLANHSKLDNDRYPNLHWASVEENI